MNRLFTVVQCDREVEDDGAEERQEDDDEDDDEEADWRHILAVSLLMTSLVLIGCFIYIHENEEQKKQSQHIYPKNNLLPLELSTPNATDADMSEMRPTQSPTNMEKILLYSDDDYTYNNNNRSSDSDIEYDEDYYYDDRSNDASDNKHYDDTAKTKPPTSTDNALESPDADGKMEVEGDDFRTRLKKEHQPQQMAAHKPSNNIKKNISNSTAATATPTATSSSQSLASLLSNSEAINATAGTSQTLSGLCLQCICETATDCMPAECGLDVPCGLFRISLPYWVDAGRPQLHNSARNLTEHAAYLNCVNNPLCAAQTVNGNIARFARDCNHDGKIDCSDHAKLHVLGPSGCLRFDMPPIFATRLERCMKKFA